MCPENIRRLRRCREDRWDFTSDDAPFFPISIHKGGAAYGFCPGKATWDFSTVQKYRLLVVTAETGALLTPGSMLEQPAWYMELLGWFLPIYDQTKWNCKIREIFGDGKTLNQGQTGVKQKGRQSKTRRSRPRLASR